MSGSAPLLFQPLEAKLSDGTTVRIRAVSPADRPLLARGFEQLSPASRYLRFLAPESALSEQELDYLTTCDGVAHFAIGAVGLGPDGFEQPLAIARFVRLAPTSEVAEPAIAVVDAQQGKGLGKQLMRLLAEAAYERGIRRFRASVLASNSAMQSMLAELDPHAHVVTMSSGVAEIELDLPTPSAQPNDQERARRLERVLAMVARELVSVRARRHTHAATTPAAPELDGSPALDASDAPR